MDIFTTRAALMAGAAIAIASPAYAQAQVGTQKTFDIPAQAAETAVVAFARQGDVQVLLTGGAARGKSTQAVKGVFGVEEGLRRLLAGTGLAARQTAPGTYLVEGVRPQVVGTAQVAAEPGAVSELVVTGTSIRGVAPTSPLFIATAQDIQHSGYSQIGDYMRSLPQNSGAGQNPGVMTGATGSSNQTNASTVNLRGLGPQATLVLLNGRRMAADGAFPSPDISAVPLAAIDRVEIITDGSSALYGSDAVAGVVNFILRKNYDGVEAGARFRTSSQGGGFEETYDILAGRTWAGGHVMAGAEYQHQNAIKASQRDFTSEMSPVVDLLRGGLRKSAFVNASQSINDKIEIYVDGLYSERDSSGVSQASRTAAAFQFVSDVWAYTIAPGASTKLPGGWAASLEGTLARSKDAIRTSSNTGIRAFQDFTNEAKAVELDFNGDLLDLPSGAVRAAFGLGFRGERFLQATSPTARLAASRDIRFAYGELFVPLVAPSETRQGLNRLDVSLAGRVEDYSDFGATTNPKAGVRYVPLPGLSLRATWGKSFKAPAFTQLYTTRTAFLYRQAQLGAPGNGTALMLFGGNPALKPERSTSWTIGGDWTPAAWQGFKISATYFDIDYRDRVVIPIGASARTFIDPGYATFIVPNPTAAQLDAAIASTSQMNLIGGVPYNPTQVVGLVNNFQSNASGQKIKGFDFSIEKTFDTAIGDLGVFGNASWLRIRQQLLPAAPYQTITGTLFNPARWRGQAGVSWSTDGWRAQAIGNYLSGETDVNLVPAGRVGSWTTLDLSLSYRFSHSEGPLAGIETAVSMTNALDRDPPFTRGAALTNMGAYWDSTQTSPLGRFTSVSIRKRF